jgi:predicted GNAT family acetyltransferase
MERTVVDNPDAGRFEIVVDGERVGFLSYQRDADTIVFTDIDTDLRLAGQGLGLTLVRHALDAAGAQGLSVLPVHPFVRDFIERHPVYLDLVPFAERPRFDLPEIA